MIILALPPLFIVMIKWVNLCKAVKTVSGTLEVLYKTFVLLLLIIIIKVSIKCQTYCPPHDD